MKKRILSAILAAAVMISVIASVSFSAFAERTIIIDDLGTPMSAKEMRGKLDAFLTVADDQIIRDDYEKMPEGMRTKSEATYKLESLMQRAEELAYDQNSSEEDLEALLLELFGGWDPEKRDFVNPNKPYGDFQDALLLRYKALDKVLYWDENTGYAVLQREDYTVESWQPLADFMAKFELDFLTVDAVNPYTGLATATRSQIYYKLQEYLALVNTLVRFEGDKETNRLRGILYDAIHIETTYGVSIEDYLARGDSDDTSELSQKIRKIMNLGDKEAAKQALLDWYRKAQELFNDPNTTAEDIKPLLTMKLLMTDTKSAEVESPFTPEELEAQTFEVAGLPDGEKRTEKVYELRGTVYFKKSQQKENGKLVFDDEGNPVFTYTATTYHYNYFSLRNGLIETYLNTLFVHNNYRKYKNSMFYFAEAENNKGGAYSSEDWKAYLAAFARGDALLGTPKAKETEFYSAIERVIAAYEKFSQTKYLVSAYDSYGKALIEYYKDNFIINSSNYEDSLTSDEYFNSDLYDIDGLRAFRRILLLYNEAMEKIGALKEEGKQGTSDYKFWEEIAKARVVDLVASKANMPFTVHESSDNDGIVRFFHNDKMILDMAKQIAEKAKAYYKDIISDVTGDSENKKYPFSEADAVTFGEDITKLEGLISRIEAYEANIASGNYQSAAEADENAVSDDQLLNAVNNLYFDMTNMQLEYHYE